MAAASKRFHCKVPSQALKFFAIGTFAITWGIIARHLLLPEVTVTGLGEISGGHPLYFLATLAPALTGVALVLAYSGPRGLRAFVSRLLIWWVVIS